MGKSKDSYTKENSNKMATLKITCQGQLFEFDTAQSAQFRACSGYVKDLFDEREADGAENTEPIEVEVENDLFGKKEIEKVREYLEIYTGKELPKFMTCHSTELIKNCLDDQAACNFVKDYNFTTMRPLQACAEYLRFASLNYLCLIRVATLIKVPENEGHSATEAMMQRNNIEGKYSVAQEVQLKADYPFLKDQA